MSKGNIVGPSWKMPFIGPFLQSMDPKFEEYYGKWISGPLSCVSVFHKYGYPINAPGKPEADSLSLGSS